MIMKKVISIQTKMHYIQKKEENFKRKQ